MRLGQGDVAGAYSHFREAKQQTSYGFDQLFVAVAEARARLAQGDLETAEGLLEARGWGVDPRFPDDSENAIDKHMLKYEHLLQVRVLLAQNQIGKALASLKPLRRSMELQERTDLRIETQVLEALALQAQDHLDEALAALEIALTLARPGGYVRIFLDEGPPMHRLLLEAVARGIEPEYSGQLLAGYPADKSEDADFSHPLLFDMAEPLSPRELQVLRLLASPLTSTEIADELFISANTVRFHIKNIYGKLDVHRRADAVDRASALGII